MRATAQPTLRWPGWPAQAPEPLASAWQRSPGKGSRPAGPPQPYRGFAARRRIVVLVVKTAQRRENVSQADGVADSRDIPQRRAGFHRVDVGSPGRKHDALFGIRELPV